MMTDVSIGWYYWLTTDVPGSAYSVCHLIWADVKTFFLIDHNTDKKKMLGVIPSKVYSSTALMWFWTIAFIVIVKYPASIMYIMYKIVCLCIHSAPQIQ